ncbi:Hep_Hag [Candidatus Koribacter versatilis Ellin345]|uniref:Hep_Hag n=1 Tax=Koribacter versatilis (strain Ellin345) TaxID=204669 RepID=Q1IKY1_KORVE|nr:tail fiber domain-containing protein [Candidatus Koribacter versatilis]ABF42469.1 Hep_Hag [Candidatus Koribacter versatilis Ellin345]
MKVRWLFIAVLSCVSLFAQQETSVATAPATAAVPRLIRFSGQLNDASKTVGITFTLHTSQKDDRALWIETQNVKLDASGKYTVLLGATKTDGIPMEVFASGEAQWLGIRVEGQKEATRVLLVSVPYALKAAEAETLAGHSATEFVTSDKLSVVVRQEMNQASTTGTSGGSVKDPVAHKGNALSSTATNFSDNTVDQVVKVTQNGTGSAIIANSPQANAVLGNATTAAGYGVTGSNAATTGVPVGVRGTTVGDNGISVYGTAAGTGGSATGVKGITAAPSGYGVFGQNTSATGPGIGFRGSTASTSGTAIYGTSTAGTGNTIGLRTSVASASGTAAVLQNTATGKIISGQSGGALNEVFSVAGTGDIATVAGLTAAGTVAGAALSAAGTVSATDVTATGTVSAPNISGTNLTASNTVSASTVTAANVTASGMVSALALSATGNVSGATVSSTGPITSGGGFFGDGSTLSRVVVLDPAAYQVADTGSADNSGAPMIAINGITHSGATPFNAYVRVQQDSGVVFKGILGVGVIPWTGSGERLMWHPYKAAFRAGSIGSAGTQWDDPNVGFYTWAGGYNTIALGLSSFSMGYQSQALGSYSNAMGYTSIADGTGAVAIGYRAGACSDYSVALGQRATTDGSLADQTSTSPCSGSSGHAGAFVWGDGSITTNVAAQANNEFRIRASGGVRLRTSVNASSPLGTNSNTGCDLPAGSGVFSCASSRTVKENFLFLRNADVLARLRTMPVSTWNYKAEGKEVRHMGPVAEDFRAAFGLGENETTVGVNDLAGVGLAAAKALDEENVRLKKELLEQKRVQREQDKVQREQQALIKALTARLTKLEQASTPKK